MLILLRLNKFWFIWKYPLINIYLFIFTRKHLYIVQVFFYYYYIMEKFALPPLIDDSSKILILGTIPGDQSIARQQYYGNKGNHFWKILFFIFQEDFSTSYEERRKLLKNNHIGLWNVLAFCMREGSSDSKIKNEVVNDFENLVTYFK